MVASTDIELRELPAHTVAYERFHGTMAAAESVVASVRSWVVTMGYQPTGPLAIEVTGRPWDSTETEMDFEIQLPVEDRAKSHPSDHVQIKRFEPARAAVLTLTGPVEMSGLGEPMQQVTSWLEGRSESGRDVFRWVEVTDRAKTSPQEQVTEVQVLLS